LDDIIEEYSMKIRTAKIKLITRRGNNLWEQKLF